MEVLVLVLLILLIASFAALGVSYRREADLRERMSRVSLRNQQRQSLEAQTQSLITRQAALEALSEVSFNALLLVDSEHQVITMNTAARTLFSQPADWREHAESVISITRHHELDDYVAAALESSDEALTHQIKLHSRPYRVRTLCIESAVGPLVALALEDVSELQRLGRARRDMVANISHELRTPITSIRLLVDTLLRGAIRDAAKAEPLAHKIEREVATLEQMAQELLDLAMIESGRAEFRLIPAPMREILSDAVRRVAALAERSRISISEGTPPEFTVLADSEQVARVLTNLLHNSIKFTPEGGRIEIICSVSADFATISISDTGPGIPITERARIFERFYRGDRSRRGSGTGLGLAIAKHIIEAHGGRIWADDPPVRGDQVGGAIISFTLPLA